MNFKTFCTLFIVVFFHWLSSAQDYRYTETLFSSSVITENVVYRTAPSINTPFTVESNTTATDLKMDIYVPQGDTNNNRPVIIFAHSGGFLLGNKNHDDMMAFCDLLAKKGYVTATIDYRLGFYPITNANLHGIRAVYRGIQDGRAAIRYLRANASTYGINPDKVYFVGSSAGAFIGLHSIYLDNLSEIPAEAGVNNYTNVTPPFNHTTPDLGSLDVGNNLSFNGMPDAVVSLWGAVQNTSLITSDNDKPVLLVHGDSDTVVPFEIGSPFNFPILDDTFGSNTINNRLDNLGITDKETYFVTGEGHEFYGTDNGTWSDGMGGNAFWDIIFDKITNFLWRQHKPTANFTHSNTGLTFDFTDTSVGATSWFWDFGDGFTSTDQNPMHTFATTGSYDVKLYTENDILSWDEKTETIDTSVLSTTDNDRLDFNYFPNPTNDRIHFSFESNYSSVSLKLYNLSGQLIRESEFRNSSEVVFQLTDVSNGIYFIKVKKDDTITSLRIIKE